MFGGPKVNKRSIITGLTLLLVGGYLKASDTTYTLKVAAVSQTNGEVQAKFLVTPEDMRVICHGDTHGISTGDYIKMEVKNGLFTIAGTKCTEIRWIK